MASADGYRPRIRKNMGMKGALPYMIGAAVSFALMGVCVKASVAALPFLVAVVFRSLVSFVLLAGYFALTRTSVRAQQHGLLLLRSIFGFTALILYFFALEHLPLSTAVVLNHSSPVFVVVLSALFLSEHRAALMIPLVILAFFGASLLIAPDLSTVNVAAVLGLTSALFAAMAYLIVSRVSKTESSPTIVFYFTMYSTIFAFLVLGGAMLLGLSDLRFPALAQALTDPVQLALLCGVGVAGTFGQLFMTAGYARERASVVSGFSYLTPVFSYLLGLWLFDEVPSASSLIGGAIIIAASVAILMLSRPRVPPATGSE